MKKSGLKTFRSEKMASLSQKLVWGQSPSKLQRISRIGGGTYGKVYAGISADNEIVAVKRNIVNRIYTDTVASIRELDILLAVQKHPFCLQLKEAFFGAPFPDGTLTPNEYNTATDKVFFLLERGEMDAQHYIREFRPGWVDRKLLAVHLFLATEFLHSRKITHRDIKPANIICFLNQDHTLRAAKLTDYGLAQYYTPQTLAPPDMVTLWYRAPEIALHKDYGLKVDVWSLGCILFEVFSGTNFIQPRSDNELCNAIITHLPFPREDYNLARQLFEKTITSSYDACQNNLARISKRLALPDYEIAAFNSSKLGGRPNSGKYDELIDLLEHTLVVDPRKRWTVSQCLNHPFFAGYRELIDRTRLEFGISSEGEALFTVPSCLTYKSGDVRKLGVKWFRLIYSVRSYPPIAVWYSHRIFFHALEMFDRFVCQLSDVTPLEADVLIWVNTFLFISAKFFRIMQSHIGIEVFANGIPSVDLEIFRQRVIQFEEYILRDVFKGQVYQPTLYEEASEFLTEVSAKRLLEILFQEEVPSGTSYPHIWTKYYSELVTLNSHPSPNDSPVLPVVSLV
jgi:mitogen-activated protein kinase 1/3